MSFELTNASAMFQELINHILYNHLNKFVITYLDDILIYSENEEDHKKHVKEILRRLQEKKLYLKSKKCEFHKQQVEYLEHIITTEELEMNSEKINMMFMIEKC